MSDLSLCIWFFKQLLLIYPHVGGNLEQKDYKMKKIKLYDWESSFDFGQHNGESLKEVFDRNPSYLSWCFQKVDCFCIIDDIFEKLPIVISLKKNNTMSNVKEQQDWLKILTDKHFLKKQELNDAKQAKDTFDYDSHYEYIDNEPIMLGDPRYDRSENPWIDVFGEGEEAETAYWNTD